MSYRYNSSRDDLPQVEQDLLDRIEQNIGQELELGGAWSWYYTYSMEYDRLVSLFLRGDYQDRRLTELPEEVIHASELILLSIGVNAVEKLPKDIGVLTNIRRCFMGNNLLREIPESITDLNSVQTLELQNNQISSFPTGIGNMTNLEDLSLGNNLLTRLPDDLGEARYLRSLRIPYNRIKKLPESLRLRTHLIRLRYGDNGVRELPDWIGDLTHLGELMLHDNELDSLPESVIHLKNLQILDLRNNNFEEIPIHVLSELTNLQEVYLYGNPLSEKFMRKFKAMSRLMPRHIRIDGMNLEDYFNKSDLYDR